MESESIESDWNKMILEQTDIWGAFPFLKETGHLISLVGGGGKTSLMYALADAFAKQGRKTLVMTSTHIQIPENRPVVLSVEEARRQWELGTFAVAGTRVKCRNTKAPDKTEEEKLAGISEALRNRLFAEAEAVLIEADGAKRHPFKVPADHEPVILPESDIVIGVAGLSCIGKTLAQACFRYEVLLNQLNGQIRTEHDIITEDTVAEVLMAEWGTRKQVGDRDYYVVLNQCDTATEREKARKTAQPLAQKGQKKIIFSKLKDDQKKTFEPEFWSVSECGDGDSI